MYIPKPLFPSVVDASSLPGPFCLETGLDLNGTCPFAGFDEILQNSTVFNTGANNSINSPLLRVLATELNDGAGIASTGLQVTL